MGRTGVDGLQVGVDRWMVHTTATQRVTHLTSKVHIGVVVALPMVLRSVAHQYTLVVHHATLTRPQLMEGLRAVSHFKHDAYFSFFFASFGFLIVPFGGVHN